MDEESGIKEIALLMTKMCVHDVLAESLGTIGEDDLRVICQKAGDHIYTFLTLGLFSDDEEGMG